MDGGQIVRPDDLLRAEVPVPRAHPSGVERKAEARLVAAHGLVGPHAFDCEGDLLGNGQRERGFGRVERVRRSVVAHELAQHAVSHSQRNERQGANSFGAERGAKGREVRRALDVADADRLRIGRVGCPGRVAVDGGAVGVRQSPPGDESDDVMRIEQENRGPLDTEAVAERIECRIVHLWQAVGSGTRTAKAERAWRT